LHGVSSSLISDRDLRFISRFWGKFQESLGSNLNFSTSAHPQTDGQSERVIQILEDTLRACAMNIRNEWIESFPDIELAYNNNYQSSIGIAPFEPLYGRKYQTTFY
jgi:hypothetical protein